MRTILLLAFCFIIGTVVGQSKSVPLIAESFTVTYSAPVEYDETGLKMYTLGYRNHNEIVLKDLFNAKGKEIYIKWYLKSSSYIRGVIQLDQTGVYSEQIDVYPRNAWLYTKITINSDYTYKFETAYNNYVGQSGASHVRTSSGTVVEADRAILENTTFRMRIDDTIDDTAYLHIQELIVPESKSEAYRLMKKWDFEEGIPEELTLTGNASWSIVDEDVFDMEKCLFIVANGNSTGAELKFNAMGYDYVSVRFKTNYNTTRRLYTYINDEYSHTLGVYEGGSLNPSITADWCELFIPLDEETETEVKFFFTNTGSWTSSYYSNQQLYIVDIRFYKEKEPQHIEFPELTEVTYGDEPFLLNAIASSGLDISYESDDNEVVTIDGNVVNIVGVGTALITASQPGNDTYLNAAPVSRELIVKKKSLTATADDKSRNYGSDNPAFSITYEGFLTGEDESVITEPEISCEADNTSNAGDYAITLSGGSATNYDITLQDGVLTVNKLSLIATADDMSRNYGSDNPEFTISYEGFLTGEDESVITEPEISCLADNTSNAGDYPITLSGGSATNYDITLQHGLLTVDKLALIATADDMSRNYGSDNPEFTISYEGFLPGEDESVITEPEISCEADNTSNAGDYAITLSGGSATNYDITLQDGVLTVNKLSLIATADDMSRNYGSDNPEFTISYEGFLTGEDESVITEPEISCLADNTSNAGDYPITLSGGSATNYDITLQNGVLTINKLALIVKAADATRQKGEPNPVFEILYDGFINDEDVSVLNVLPVAYSLADETSDAGEYDIIVEGGDADNYYFVYDSEMGVLTVTFISGSKSVVISKEVKIYPNPVVDVLNISGNGFNDNAKGQLYNSNGNLVKEFLVNEKAVDISYLSSGVYILIIEELSFKIIKR